MEELSSKVVVEIIVDELRKTSLAFRAGHFRLSRSLPEAARHGLTYFPSHLTRRRLLARR